MPELPEVEAMRRDIVRRVQGDTLVECAFHAPGWAVGGDADAPLSAAGGARLQSVYRRSRLLLLDFGARVLVIEPRMTGRPRWEPPLSGARFSLRFAVGPTLWWEDVRGLGSAQWWPRTHVVGTLTARTWGPDAWPAPRSGAWWAARFQGARGACKPALMMSERVAGLGNIAASELCWRLGWSPWQPVPAMDVAAWQALAEEVPRYVADVLADLDKHGMLFVRERESPPETFAVYARAGDGCRRCSTAIQRATQAGRSTFWCPGCQSGGS